MIKVKYRNPSFDEIDSLHFANVLYWRQGTKQSREAKAQYQRRQDRLRDIRALRLSQGKNAVVNA
jgi:hypothetical protein